MIGFKYRQLDFLLSTSWPEFNQPAADLTKAKICARIYANNKKFDCAIRSVFQIAYL